MTYQKEFHTFHRLFVLNFRHSYMHLPPLVLNRLHKRRFPLFSALYNHLHLNLIPMNFVLSSRVLLWDRCRILLAEHHDLYQWFLIWTPVKDTTIKMLPMRRSDRNGGRSNICNMFHHSIIIIAWEGFIAPNINCRRLSRRIVFTPLRIYTSVYFLESFQY